MNRIFYQRLNKLIMTLLILITPLALTAVIEDYETSAKRILQRNCTTIGCHAGNFPAMELDLSVGELAEAMFDVSSQGSPNFKLIDSKDPAKSYLLLKIEGAKGIKGQRMPLNRSSLSVSEIENIKNWIFFASQNRSAKSKTSVSTDRSTALKKPDFWSPKLINLITPQAIGKKLFLFRISHRFYPSVADGYDVFYGLDGPAAMQLSFGYGLSDRLSVTLARSNRFKEWAFSLHGVLFQGKNLRDLPVSAAFNFGIGLVTEKRLGISTFSSDNLKFNFQFSFSCRPLDFLSIAFVPAYATNTDHWNQDSRHTLALGTGASFSIINDISMILEWIPVLSGYHSRSQGWGVGLEKKMGGHVFQVFILSSVGLTSSQYFPGGDLCLKDGDFRIGFNIFRWF